MLSNIIANTTIWRTRRGEPKGVIFAVCRYLQVSRNIFFKSYVTRKKVTRIDNEKTLDSSQKWLGREVLPFKWKVEYRTFGQ